MTIYECTGKKSSGKGWYLNGCVVCGLQMSIRVSNLAVLRYMWDVSTAWLHVLLWGSKGGGVCMGWYLVLRVEQCWGVCSARLSGLQQQHGDSWAQASLTSVLCSASLFSYTGVFRVKSIVDCQRGKWAPSFWESSFCFFTISSCFNAEGHMGVRVVSRTHLVVSLDTPSCCIALNHHCVLEHLFVVWWAVTTVSRLSLGVLWYSLPQSCFSFYIFLANDIKARVARVHFLCCLCLLP